MIHPKQSEIVPVSWSRENLGYILTGEGTDHGKVQKSSTWEFKREAVQLTQTSGKPIAHIAQELDISDSRVHQ